MFKDGNIGEVVAVCLSKEHTFSKEKVEKINLLKGLGVEGDAHMGKTVQHLSRKEEDPHYLNLRQVHLIHYELLCELRANGFDLKEGDLGENITTIGLDLLNMPKGTRLRIGESACVEITGLRNPCAQIENFKKGLLSQVLYKDEQGELIRKTGVMAIVIEQGEVKPKDKIKLEYPDEPFLKLEVV